MIANKNFRRSIDSKKNDRKQKKKSSARRIAQGRLNKNRTNNIYTSPQKFSRKNEIYPDQFDDIDPSLILQWLTEKDIRLWKETHKTKEEKRIEKMNLNYIKHLNEQRQRFLLEKDDPQIWGWYKGKYVDLRSKISFDGISCIEYQDRKRIDSSTVEKKKTRKQSKNCFLARRSCFMTTYCICE